MKKLKLLTVCIPLLLGGCASMSAQQYQTRLADCNSRTAFTIDASGNLVKAAPNCSHIQPTGGNALSTGEIVLVGGAVAGVVYLIYKLIDEKNASTTTTNNVAPQQSPLFQTGGTSTQSWSGDFVQPIYTPL